MRILEDTFTILHIKISHVKVLGISARSLMTLAFIVIIAFGSFQLFKSTQGEFDVLGFVESAVYVAVVVYAAMFWLKSWVIANQMLQKASDSNNETEKKDKITPHEHD